jgi:hypothetical protein
VQDGGENRVRVNKGIRMSFKSDHPDYKGYESDEYHVSKLPSGFSSALEGFIAGHCEDTQQIKAVVNDIAGRIPMELTQNWGRDYLLSDLSHYLSRMTSQPLPKVMDFLADLCSSDRLGISEEDMNEMLESQYIGYVLESDQWGQDPYWILRDSVTSRTAAIEATTHHVKDICEQTLDHLNQAREHLVNTKNDRDRKDAIRDCLSAMESMLKTLSGKSDIKDAVTELRSQKTWGPEFIIKDGLSLWDRMHHLYPDIRHGNPKQSDLTDEEALYWLERITCYIRYISRVQNR